MEDYKAYKESDLDYLEFMLCDYPKCPHCGHDNYIQDVDDGDIYTPTCEKCEKDFKVIARVSVSFDTIIPKEI